MLIPTGLHYITHDPDILDGEPIIVGTRVSVKAIVDLWRLGTSPEQISKQVPPLTLKQVVGLLSFYLANQSEINEDIERHRRPDELVPIAGYRQQFQQQQLKQEIELAQRLEKAWSVARQAIDWLKPQIGLKPVWVFGSLVHGHWFSATSDIDLAVEGLPSDRYLTVVAQLQDI